MGNKLGFFKTFTALVILPILFFSVIHEKRHETIAQQYGCSAEIDYTPSTDYFMQTTYQCPEDMDKTKNLLLDMEQRNVETVGYQLLPILMMTLLNTVYITIIAQNKKENHGRSRVKRQNLLVKKR